MARFGSNLDRIRVTTTTTGTGAYTVVAATAGYRDFSHLTNGARFPYTVQFGTNWECGVGEKQGTTVVRHKVLSSTNGNVAVNWGAGSKFLFVDQLSEQQVVSPDGSISVQDNFTTGETEIQGFNTTDLSEQVLGGVDIEIELDDEDDPTELLIHNARKIQTVADSTTIALDFSANLGSTKVVNVAGNRAITFNNVRLGQVFETRLIYDSTGGRVVTWPSTVQWVNGYTPAYTPVGGGSDTFEFQKIASSGVTQYIGFIKSTERPVILTGESTADVEGNLVIVDGVNSGPNEFQWLTATIDSDYNDYTISKTGTVSGGTFDLTIGIDPEDNQTIENIPYNVTAFELLALIWTNTTLDETEINVDGLTAGAGSTRTISGDGDVHLQFLGAARYVGYVITIDSANLTGGGSYDVNVTPIGSGSQVWPFNGGATYAGSTMKFRYNGNDSVAVAVNADAATIATAVGAIVGIGAGNIVVTRLAIGSYYFQFIAGKSGTNMPFELQFSPSFLPSSSVGAATGQLYSTARNGFGPAGSNETNTISITGTPTQGTLLYTVLGNAILVPVTATSASLQTQLNTAIGAGNSSVAGGPLPSTPLVVTFIGTYLTTNIANSTLDDSGAGSSDIDWSICEGKIISLLPGDGTYTLRHVKPIPGKTLFVTLISDGATGDVTWTDAGIGVPVDWGNAGLPIIPADGESVYLEFYAETVDDIHGKIWFHGEEGGGDSGETNLPGYNIEIDQTTDPDTGVVTNEIHNYWTTEVLVDAPTIVWDLDPEKGGDKVVTIAANRNVDVVNEEVGKEVKFQVIQGGAGSFVVNFLFEVEWLEGFKPVQTEVVGKSDEWHFLCVRKSALYVLAKFKAWVETTERPQPLEDTAGPTAANEVQTIHISPVPLSGTWTVSFMGATSNPIPHNANATPIRLIMQAMPTIQAGNLLVSGGRLGMVPIRLEFVNALGGQNLPQVTVQTSGLQF